MRNSNRAIAIGTGGGAYYVPQGFPALRSMGTMIVEEQTHNLKLNSLRETPMITRNTKVTKDKVPKLALQLQQNEAYGIAPATARTMPKTPMGAQLISPRAPTARSLSSHRKSFYTEIEHSRITKKFAELTSFEVEKNDFATPFDMLRQCKTLRDFLSLIRNTPYHAHFRFLERSPKLDHMTPQQLHDILTANQGGAKDKIIWNEDDFPIRLSRHHYYFFKVATKGKQTPLTIQFVNRNEKLFTMDFAVYYSNHIEKPTAKHYDKYFEGDAKLILDEKDERVLFVQDQVYFGVYARDELFIQTRYRFGGVKKRQKLPPDYNDRVLPSLADYFEKIPEIQEPWINSRVYRPSVVVARPPTVIPNRNPEVSDRRKDNELDYMENKLVSVHKMQLLKDVKALEAKYQRQLSQKRKFQDSWLVIIKLAGVWDSVCTYFLAKKAAMNRTQVLAFKLILFQARFKKYARDTRGPTLKDRVLFDVRM
jgi:hypothetical protein